MRTIDKPLAVGERAAVIPRLHLLSLVVLAMVVAGCGSVPERSSQSPLRAGSPRADAANAVLFRAIALVGTPYRYGGNTPRTGFDCSGLVGYVFRDAAGMTLPRTAAEMSHLRARDLPLAALQSGDLVFFKQHRQISHVGIYVGNDRFVNAPNEGGTVRLDSLDGGWWRDHFAFGKRILD